MISVMYSTLLILWRSESGEVNTSNFGSVGQVEEGGVCPLVQIDATLIQPGLEVNFLVHLQSFASKNFFH